MTILIKRINDPTDTQIEQAVDICLRAFEGDLAVHSMSGGDPDVQRRHTRAMFKAGALDGVIYFAVHPTAEAPLGVALCFGPGKGLFKTEAQRTQGWNDVWASFPPALKSWWEADFMKPIGQLEENTIGSELILQSWYIDVLATDPEHQGRGIGTSLVKAMCNKAKEGGEMLSLGALTGMNVGERSLPVLKF
ncbi:hypothetical protein BDZ89DRAFT_1066978 [Hymenopellis radicata]|nr:hypothetical protein BDZ89DRAFT_1066978 [Hymenopellis radicata]